MPDIDTPYGKVNADALQTLQETFDTRTILRAVDQFDGIRARCEPEGLRDDLLRLHGMAHTVINGASLSYATHGPTLTEQIDAIMEELDDWIAILRQTQHALRPLEALRAELGNQSGDESE
jgi:hypothetical protein